MSKLILAPVTPETETNLVAALTAIKLAFDANNLPGILNPSWRVNPPNTSCLSFERKGTIINVVIEADAFIEDQGRVGEHARDLHTIELRNDKGRLVYGSKAYELPPSLRSLVQGIHAIHRQRAASPAHNKQSDEASAAAALAFA